MIPYPYTNPIRDIPAYSAIKRPPEMRGCVVCSTEFAKRKNADTFELRLLCATCIERWEAREVGKEGYRKDA